LGLIYWLFTKYDGPGIASDAGTAVSNAAAAAAAALNAANQSFNTNVASAPPFSDFDNN
jgi:hypothetical protein